MLAIEKHFRSVDHDFTREVKLPIIEISEEK